MKYKVTLNGKVYEVEVEQGQAILLDEYAIATPVSAPAAAPAAAVQAAPPVSAPSPGGGEAITSPLPGNILKILVRAGDSVKAGQVVLVLEAMKMENEITASKDGVVGQILTNEGAVVSTGTALLTIA